MNEPPRSRRRRWVGRVLLLVFFGVAGWLVWRQSKTVDWSEVAETLRAYRTTTLIGAGALAALSYVIYGCFDVLSRRYVRARVSDVRSAMVGAVSYAFNLNLGAIVGGAGFRLRMYSRLGVEQGRIAAIIAFSMATNWVGYLLVAGVVFAIGGVQFPEGWKAGDGVMRIIGAAMVSAALGYVALCRFSRRRDWSFRGRSFTLPSTSMALRQLLLGASNWLVIAGVAYLLLSQQAPYATVLSVVCVASIAGAMAHIPGGLGVIEAVYVAMLGWSIGTGPILAAVLAYRAIYYLIPLAVAGVLFLVLEWLAREAGTAPHGAVSGERSASRMPE
jgi:uncharacterized membrane protein YbhN (UPF0104 family)